MSRHILFSVILIMFAGCSETVTQTPQDSLPSNFAPLTSVTTPKKDLATINSVFVAGATGPGAEKVASIINKIASAELSFSVQVPKTPGDCSAARNVDACLVIDMVKYQERAGSGIAVSTGASVAFTIHLKRVADGRDIWLARYSFDDTPLSDDVIRFGSNLNQKGGNAIFTTAISQFEKGFQDALRRLNDDRTKQFLK